MKILKIVFKYHEISLEDIKELMDGTKNNQKIYNSSIKIQILHIFLFFIYLIYSS